MEPAPRRRALPVVPAVALSAYLALTALVLLAPPQEDAVVLEQLAEMRTPGLTEAALLITQLGDVWLLTGVSLLTVTALALRSRRAALFVAASVGGAGVIHYALKALMARPRPAASPVYEPGGWSFPSGHSMATFCFLVALALLLPSRLGRLRVAAFVIVAATILLVGTTRLYLGVHYPTDVLAGWAIGLAWVGTLHTFYRRGELKDGR